MSLLDVKNTVRALLKRGSALDSEIPVYIRHAAKLIERQHNWEYMKRWLTFTVNLNAAEPRRIELPFSVIKKIEFFRWNVDSTVSQYSKQYFDLVEGDPRRYAGLETGMPQAYWRDGANALILDRTVDQAYVGEVQLYTMTSWPSADDATNWLIEAAEDLLVWGALAQAWIREPNQFANAMKMRGDAFVSALAMDAEIKEGNRPRQMQYRGGAG